MNMKMKARLEQIKQAKQIHGGMVNMCAIAMGVKLSRLPIPTRKLRKRLYTTIYGKKYHPLCEEELEQPLSEFRSLNALFTRGVKSEQRPLPSSPGQMLCPCDGTVQDLGTLSEDTLLTAKGVEYSLESLLPGVDICPYVNGQFSILFLSPADCHRVFSPVEARLHEIVHVPGRRLLVHPPFQRKEFPVFSLNERIVMRLETRFGNCLLVLVAGWGVGNITHPFAARFRISNRRRVMPLIRKTRKIRPNRRVRMSRRRVSVACFEEPISFERGEWIATFELGSTVIMLTEQHRDVASHFVRDDKVQYGQPAYSFPSINSTFRS